MASDQPRNTEILSFGPFRLAVAERLLTRDGTPIELRGRALDILIALTAAPNEVLSKEDLLSRVWQGVVVEETSLRFHMTVLRRALGDGKDGARYIATVSGRGYCFVAPISRLHEPKANEPLGRGSMQPLHLPSRLTRMVGRDWTVQELRTELLEKRFVSIVGPGGIGKTTVAVAVAHELIRELGNDIFFVDLSAINEPALLVTSVCAALGCSTTGQDILGNVTNFLGGRRVLLVLDGCEHLIGAAAIVAEHLRRNTPEVHLLTTTREALRVEGENVKFLSSLPVPDYENSLTAVEVREAPSVQLFVDRAAAAGHRFDFTDDELGEIVKICHRVDGIALAIELAASQVVAHGVFGVSELLDRRFGLMWPGRRLAPARHQTLQATLDWSYSLLSGLERRTLCRLSVFAGAFSVDAAQAVAGEDDYEKVAVVDAITGLAGKSLLKRSERAGSTQYRLLDTTRSYASKKLEEAGHVQRFARRHAEYFATLITPASKEVEGESKPASYFVSELDNVRAALDWAYSSQGDPKLGGALTAAFVPVWTYLGLLSECSKRVELALSRMEDVEAESQTRMRLYVAFGATLFFTIGPDKRTRQALSDALDLAADLGDIGAQMQTLWVLWGLQLNAGECLAALDTVERFAEIAGKTNSLDDNLFVDRLMANVLTFRGHQNSARTRLEKVLEQFTESGPLLRNLPVVQDVRLAVRLVLARVLWLQGYTQTAMKLSTDCLADAQAGKNKFSVCEVLRLAVCPITLMSGDLVAARRAIELLSEIATRNNAPFWKIVAQCLQGKLLVAEGAFDRGVAMLQAHIAETEQAGWLVCVPEYLGALAEGMIGLGRTKEALDAVGAGLLMAERTGEEWFVPELLRIKGSILKKKNERRSLQEAESCFVRAIEMARQQAATFWEIRALLKLAELKVGENERIEALEILSPTWDERMASCDTADLRVARELFDSLQSRDHE